jgi:hypothetical protein
MEVGGKNLKQNVCPFQKKEVEDKWIKILFLHSKKDKYWKSMLIIGKLLSKKSNLKLYKWNNFLGAPITKIQNNKNGKFAQFL